MAVTGKFDADFSDFKNEVDESTVKLKAMEEEADAVGAAVDKALQPKGGVGGVLDALGGAMQNVGTQATTTAGALDGLAASTATASQGGAVLVSTMEMEAAGFQTAATAAAANAAEIVSLGGAVTVLGAAMIGWNLGRHVAEFFQLDEAIGKATAATLGMGDAAYQAGASGMATLERASEAAGRQITNMTEAVRILTDKDLERLKNVLQGVADQQADRMFEKWNHQLEELQGKGLIPALTRDLESHAFKLKDLAQWYQVDIEAIEELQRRIDKQKASDKENNQADLDFRKQVQKDLDEQTKKENELATLKDKVHGIERQHQSELTAGFEVLSAAERQQTQKELEDIAKKIAAHQALLEVIAKEEQAAGAANTARTLGPGTADPAAAAAARRDAALDRAAAMQKAAPEADVSQIILKAWLDFDEQVGARLKAGTGGSTTVNMNVSGVLDPATIKQLTDAVSRQLMTDVKQDRYLPGR